MRFEGKTALVTGAANGIGRASVERFLAEGATVVGVDRDAAALAELAAAHGDRFDPIVADVSQADDANDYVARTVDRHGRIDIAFLNAGIEGRFGTIASLTVEDFDAVMAVNTRGVWIGLSRLLAAMRDAGGGVITITSSTGGLRGVPGLGPYSASKHAVIGLMKTAALEGGRHNIRVNSVNPGPIDTRMLDALGDASPTGGAKGQPGGGTPLGRIADPAEVAGVVAFLSGSDASFCTGGVYTVDGGIVAGSLSRLD